jgi:hypothetical protein
MPMYTHFFCTVLQFWGNTCPTYLNSLSVLQKKCIRAIANAPFLEHTAPLFRKYKILPFTQLIEFRTLCIAHQVWYETAPPTVIKLFSKQQDVSKKVTRATDHKNFFVPQKNSKRRACAVVATKPNLTL